MNRQLLHPRWIAAHVVVIAIAVSFISLGLWQIDRHHEQQRENERIAGQLASDPVPLDQALAREDVDLLPVTVTGTYDPSGEVRLSPRSRNERPGFEVLTPLATSAGVVVVDRGWVPLDDPVPPAPAGTVTLEGRLRAPVGSRQVLTDDEGTVTLVSNVDLAVLAPQVDGLLTTAYVEIVDEEARLAGVIPRPADPPVLESGPHLSYAAQWFAFTIIGVVGYPLLLRRRLAEASEPSQASSLPVS